MNPVCHIMQALIKDILSYLLDTYVPLHAHITQSSLSRKTGSSAEKQQGKKSIHYLNTHFLLLRLNCSETSNMKATTSKYTHQIPNNTVQQTT